MVRRKRKRRSRFILLREVLSFNMDYICLYYVLVLSYLLFFKKNYVHLLKQNYLWKGREDHNLIPVQKEEKIPVT